jgi:AraC-like DNA-binding protein
VSKALGILHARVAEPWTVASLAAKVGLSRSGFAARFTALVGEPPLQYLARWRMARAAELLRDTNESIVEIAERVGYESVPSFGKAFKRWQGESPGAFRREQSAANPLEALAATTQ